LILAPNER